MTPRVRVALRQPRAESNLFWQHLRIADFVPRFLPSELEAGRRRRTQPGASSAWSPERSAQAAWASPARSFAFRICLEKIASAVDGRWTTANRRAGQVRAAVAEHRKSYNALRFKRYGLCGNRSQSVSAVQELLAAPSGGVYE